MLENIDTIQSILFDCQCVVFLIDITKNTDIKLFQKLMENISFNDFSYLKIILAQNKIDLNREISEDNIKTFLDEHKIKDNMKISIKEKTGIKELSKKIIDLVNYLEKDICNNFSCQLREEYKDDYKQNKDKENKGINANKEFKSMNIIFLGDSQVGKTSLFSRINKNNFTENFLSTIGMERVIKTFKYNNEIYKINLVDTAGQERFRTLPKKFYKNANGIFLLFDLTNKESFNDISIWIDEIKTNLGSQKVLKEEGIVIYLIGNKLDKLQRVINREEAEDKASFYGVKYFEISCKLNINIQEIYARLVNDCIPFLPENKEQSHFHVEVKKQKKRTLKEGLCC